MDGLEMRPPKGGEVVIGESYLHTAAVDAYPGVRTAGTRNIHTRVRRLFSYTQIFFFALTFMSSWEVMALNLQAVFYNGGPQALAWVKGPVEKYVYNIHLYHVRVWSISEASHLSTLFFSHRFIQICSFEKGVVVVVAGALAQSASLAEMSSLLPIAGAQYHWTDHLAPPRQRRFITWMQGWVTWFGWVSLLAGVANTTCYMLQALVIVNYESYEPKRWHLTLIIFALLIVQGLMNMYTFWIIPWIETLAGFLHLVMFVIFVVVLTVMAPAKHTAKFVFLEQASASGWTNKYVSWNIGLLTPTWGFVGFDSAVHMSEEVRKARHAVPRAMFWSIALNGILAYAIIIVILFCMGDLDAALNAPFPIVEICTQATGSVPAATAMVCGLLIISLAVNLGSIASASRLTWAWSRDGGLPAWFSYISPKRRIPIRSIWLPIFLVMVLACLNIGSTAAFGAFVALASFALFASYFIAIGCMLHARLHGRVQSGGWTLGRLGLPVNAFALLYTAYVMIFLVFPASVPVTATGMNYALPIFGLVFLIALGLWFVWARKHWPGLNKVVIDLVVADSDRATKE